MAEPPLDQYARLPADLLDKLLHEAPAVTAEVRRLLEPALRQQDKLRTAAEDLDLIRQAGAGDPLALCAVDGGFAVERTVAVDIVMSIAVGVEGFTPPGVSTAWVDNQHDSFQRVLLHDVANDRLARAVTVILELATIADAPHEFRIYDGSHLTPVIQLNSGLSAEPGPVNDLSTSVGLDHGVVDSFDSFVNDARTVAMPKLDSSSALAKKLGKQLGQAIPGDDKYVTHLVLRGGEYTEPRRVPAHPWSALHFSEPPDSATKKAGLSSQLNQVIQPFKDRELYYTYWKPSDHSPSYRLEIKPDLARSPDLLRQLFASMRHQIALPFVREPYPQFLADAMAKSVGLGIAALQAAAHIQLTKEVPELSEQLIHSYRTEGT